MNIHRKLALHLLLLFALLLPNHGVSAEGPGTGGRRIRLDDEPAGPYLLRVVTSPTPPRVENLYVEVRVTEAGSNTVLTDVHVSVTASLTQGEADWVSVKATHDIAPIPNEYAAHVLIPEPGVWRIAVRIEGPLGNAEVSFLERVASPSSLGPILSIGAPFGGLAILILIFLRLQRGAKGEQAEGRKSKSP